MNGFDVSAIGWVVTRDAYAEIARAWVGSHRQTSTEVLASLANRWLAVRTCLLEASGAARGDVLASPGTASWLTIVECIDDFIVHMVSCCPQRYSGPALRRRCSSAAAQAFVGIVGCIGASSLGNSDRLLLGDIATILFLMAVYSLISAIQLWQTYRVVKNVVRRRGTTGAVIE